MTPPVPPLGSSVVHESDAFQRVGRALIANWLQWSLDPNAGDHASTSAQQRNRLLDDTGSDHRPLVDLLLDLGHTVRPALQRIAPTPLSASAWDTARAPLVHQIVSTRYLQPDVARWAVDVWGRALGVSPAPGARERIASPQLRTTEIVPAAAATGTASAAAATAKATLARATARFGTLPPLPSTPKPARPNAPSWAGGPASFGVGAIVKPGARSALANSGRLVPGASRVQGPKYSSVERMAGMVLAGLLVVVSISMWRALGNRTPSAAGAAEPALPSLPAASVPRAATIAPRPSTDASPARSGPDTPAATPHEPFTGAAETATAPNAPFVSPMLAGVAGRYRVTQRIRSVDGSSSCESVASALGVGRETEERITHVPGRAAFRLDSRGVAGTLDSEGRFVAGPLSGTTNNIPWQFRMRGRFVSNGFIGETETYTQAILRWGRTQSCVVTADLSAIRLPE
ncbi:hypothetical protein [Gemmatimonas sp.]|uniref:hypothetical protein n=1 Tax=Gemmatimonas sp. TaxID=1962908 RepID=UPI00286C3523|nr:hypothetical protein [Gemmatimonas sp.]